MKASRATGPTDEEIVALVKRARRAPRKPLTHDAALS